MTFNGTSGHLATILSAAEDAFLYTPSEVDISGAFANSELWVGASQIAGTTTATANWSWVNGEGAFTAPGYTNWFRGEPNDAGSPGNEQFLAIGLQGGYGWNDEGNWTGLAGYVVIV